MKKSIGLVQPLTLAVFLLLFFLPDVVFAQDDQAQYVEKLDFANGLFSRGLHELALLEYQKFIDEYKEGELLDDALFGVAECHFFMEAHAEALAAHQKFLSMYPQDGKAHVAYMRIGQIHFMQNNFQEALAAFEKIEENKLPKGLKQTFRFYAGRSNLQLNQNAAALIHLQKATAYEDSDFSAQSFLFLGDAYLSQDNHKEALKAYAKAEELAKDDQIKIWSHFKRGEIHFKSESYEEAINSYRDFISKYPSHSLNREASLNLMSAYFNVGDFKTVESIFDTINLGDRKNKEDFELYYVLANAQIRQFQLVKAFEIIKEALTIETIDNQQKTRGLAKKVEILIKLKDYQQSLDIIENALAPIAQENDELLFFEAESYYGLNQYHAALSTYEKILKDYPQSAFLEEARWGRALTLKALGREEEALSYLMEFQETTSRDVLKEGAHYNRILLNAQLSKNDEAIALAKEYLSVYPFGDHYEKVLYLMGTLYSKMGQFEDAIGIYRQYEKDFPDSSRLAEVRFLLAYNQQASDKWEEAIQSYNAINAVGKENKYYYSALKNSAGLYIQENKPDEAFVYLTKILEEFEENDLTTPTFIWLAQQFIDQKKYQQALSALEKVDWEKATPQEKAAVAYFKAESFYGINEHQKAIEQYDLAISSPEAQEYTMAAKVGKATSLKAMSKFEEAGSALSALVENNPQDHTVSLHARYHLGEIEELKGNIEAAVKYYLLIAVLYDDTDFVPKALFKAGELLEKQKKQTEALKAYEELIVRFEQSELAAKADERIKAIKTK